MEFGGLYADFLLIHFLASISADPSLLKGDNHGTI